MSEQNTLMPVAVLGAGTMGAGIAQVAASAGHPVFLFDINADAIHASLKGLQNSLQKRVAKGKMTSEQCDSLLSRIAPCSNLGELSDVGLIIEAIVERLDIKQKVFAELEDICHSDTIFATNTSSISITAIGAALQKPQKLVGMHFFNPAPVLKLVEVISGQATSPDVARFIYDTAVSWGKTPVYAKSTPGFIVNRVARPFYAEGLRILEEGGADVVTIDAAMREAGNFRMGPFELMDLIGHDVNYAVTRSVYDAFYQDPRFKPSLTQLELVNGGFLGRKSGRGFYHYGSEEGSVEAGTADSSYLPENVLYATDLGLIGPIAEMVKPTAIVVAESTELSPGTLVVDDVTLALTDGRSATERASDDSIRNLVLVDLCFDFSTQDRVVLAVSEQCSADAKEKAVGFFKAIGKHVSVIDDIPGMIVMRTVAMLANEAADVVNQQIASVADVDLAMKNGVNYPRGPLQWADVLGVDYLATVLRHLQISYGEDRYRMSPLIRRNAFTRKTFYP